MFRVLIDNLAPIHKCSKCSGTTRRIIGFQERYLCGSCNTIQIVSLLKQFQNALKQDPMYHLIRVSTTHRQREYTSSITFAR